MNTALIAATLVAALVPTHASAMPQDAAPAARSIAVATAGLDLARADHVARLDARIARAARSLCAASALDLAAQNDEAACRAALVAATAPQRAHAIAAAGTTPAVRTASR